MASPELTILRALLNKDTYHKYHSVIDYAYLKENYKDIHRIYLSLDSLWKTYPDPENHTVEDLELVFKADNPQLRGADITNFGFMFRVIDELTVDEKVVSGVLDTIAKRHAAGRLARLAHQVEGGFTDFSELQEEAEKLSSQSEGPKLDVEFVSDDLDELLDEAVCNDGLRWRLHSLNKRLGPLRKGNFGIVFARVETGKTTFLADCAASFAVQSDNPVLWFNNEEAGANVKLRIIQSHFGIDIPTLVTNRGKYKADYKEQIGSRLRLVDQAIIDRRTAERIIDKVKPSVIIFDQLDKITGFSADRPDLVLGKIYQWAREIAKKHAPVIGVCQADGTAEGTKWLGMQHMADSKTSKPAEADWILGIGKVHAEGYEETRHLHLCKNKLMGGPDTDPELRHDKWDVHIRPKIARYEDFASTR